MDVHPHVLISKDVFSSPRKPDQLVLSFVGMPLKEKEHRGSKRACRPVIMDARVKKKKRSLKEAVWDKMLHQSSPKHHSLSFESNQNVLFFYPCTCIHWDKILGLHEGGVA